MQVEREERKVRKEDKVYGEERKKPGLNRNPRGIYTLRAKAPPPTTP